MKRAGAAAGAGAIGSLPGCCPRPPLYNLGFPQFEYVVVLMMENRAFDNLLGFTYDPAELPPGVDYQGVVGRNLSNPIPPYADQFERGVVPVMPGMVYDNPNPDPGEPYPHVNTQLFGTVLPESNRYKDSLSMEAPFNLPDPVPFPPPMNGFVVDYINNFVNINGRQPTYDEYKVIMECYPREALPVMNTLARQFAVCDHWHCAVPSQTFCNRSFFHAGRSAGFVTNAPYQKWIFDNNGETIFNRIEECGGFDLSWRIYFDPQDIVSLTALIHFPVLRPYFRSRIRTMDRFYDDVRTGCLPRYSFIEPRLLFNHNDMHPPVKIFGHTQPSSILPGEVLINNIYEAIRRSDSPLGNNFRNTLFVVTFDEHGGCYDHVPPPPGIPPDESAPPGQMDFRFDRLGVRIPTIFVSAFIDAGTIINTPLHHNSLLRTLSQKWGLGHLTERDRTATDLSGIFNRSSPRPRDEWPVITPLPIPPDVEAASLQDRDLNDLQRGIVGLVAAIDGDEPPAITGVNEALEYIRNRAGGLFDVP